MNASRPIVEFHIDRGRASGATTALLARELIASAALIPSVIEREAFVQQIARNGSSMDALMAELSQLK
ncbi:MAG: hypothetical protein IPP40_13810, partial [bacterium]|nr:hypothetical protein [bacterium]